MLKRFCRVFFLFLFVQGGSLKEKKKEKKKEKERKIERKRERKGGNHRFS